MDTHIHIQTMPRNILKPSHQLINVINCLSFNLHWPLYRGRDKKKKNNAFSPGASAFLYIYIFIYYYVQLQYNKALFSIARHLYSITYYKRPNKVRRTMYLH